MNRRGDSYVLDGAPDLEMLGKPCAYCGSLCEGFHSINRDGAFDGPEVPLCINCGAFDTPLLEEIWEKISESALKAITQPSTTLRRHILRKLRGRLTAETLREAFGCDACGVKQHSRVDEPVHAKLFGGTHPGVWALTGLELCDTCKKSRSITSVVAHVLANYSEDLPVKCKISRINGPNVEEVYPGVERWIAAHTKGGAIKDRRDRVTVEREALPALRSRIDQAREKLGQFDSEPEG